jgi:hypothetical protein
MNENQLRALIAEAFDRGTDTYIQFCGNVAKYKNQRYGVIEVLVKKGLGHQRKSESDKPKAKRSVLNQRVACVLTEHGAVHFNDCACPDKQDS